MEILNTRLDVVRRASGNIRKNKDVPDADKFPVHFAFDFSGITVDDLLDIAVAQLVIKKVNNIRSHGKDQNDLFELFGEFDVDSPLEVKVQPVGVKTPKAKTWKELFGEAIASGDMDAVKDLAEKHGVNLTELATALTEK